MRAIEVWITGISDAWWVHLVVAALSFFDGFFPTVPSESVVVSLASLWSSSGHPSILLLTLAAWAGACAGDNLGYVIGRTIGWQRFRFFREGRGHAAVEAAERGLRRRALLFLMTARYIPFGRTAVNLVAGAVGYPHRAFFQRDLLSTFVWAVYSAGIGALAGQWFAHNHTLGIVVAVVVAVTLSLLVGRITSTVHARLHRRADARERDETTAGSAPGAAVSGDAEPEGASADEQVPEDGREPAAVRAPRPSSPVASQTTEGSS